MQLAGEGKSMTSQFTLSNENQPYSDIYDFLEGAENEIVIFSPYINPNVLNKLLANKSANVSVITTWKLQDLWFGSSSLDTYTYAKNNSIKLFVNNRIHLKVYMVDWKECVSGSANLTERGMGLSSTYNYELNAKHDNIDLETSIYLRSIIAESKLVNESIYEEYKKALLELPDKPNLKDVCDDLNAEVDEFLVSSLPMSLNINALYNLYSNNYKTDNEEELNCALHDVALFKIPKKFTRSEFYSYLSEAFFDSLFVDELLGFVGEKGRYFGEVKEWIQNNCSDVPVPSRRDLTGNIQVLYKWIVELSNGRYAVDRPNYSERIYKVK